MGTWISSRGTEPTDWSTMLPCPSRTTTNTPPRLSRSASSEPRSSPDSTVWAAASARSRASFSIPESKMLRKSKKSARPNASRTAPMTRAFKTVRRHRIGKRPVYPLAQVPDINVHYVGLDAELLLPHPREQEVPREYPARVAGHELEKVVLSGGQVLHLAVTAPDLPGRRVDLQIRHPQHLVCFCSTQERPQPGQKLLRVEGLGEVVVCTQVKAVDLIGWGVAGSQHDDRHLVALLPELLHHTDPVHTRQHDVQDDRRRAELRCGFQSRRPVRGAPHPQAPVLQLELDKPSYRAVVFHNENTCPRLHLSSSYLPCILLLAPFGHRLPASA